MNYAGYVGCFIGLLGGILGTYVSIKNSTGPRERAFIIKASLLCWIFVVGFLAALFLAPPFWRWVLWSLYILLLLWGIIAMNKAQSRIRSAEENSVRR